MWRQIVRIWLDSLQSLGGGTVQPPEPITPWGALTDTHDAEMVAFHNAYRKTYGLKPLLRDPALDALANKHSGLMRIRKRLFHPSPTVLANVAGYSPDPRATFSQWEHSPEHRQTILTPHLARIGVGVARDNAGRHYWTVRFE